MSTDTTAERKREQFHARYYDRRRKLFQGIVDALRAKDHTVEPISDRGLEPDRQTIQFLMDGYQFGLTISTSQQWRLFDGPLTVKLDKFAERRTFRERQDGTFNFEGIIAYLEQVQAQYRQLRTESERADTEKARRDAAQQILLDELHRKHPGHKYEVEAKGEDAFTLDLGPLTASEVKTIVARLEALRRAGHRQTGKGAK